MLFHSFTTLAFALASTGLCHGLTKRDESIDTAAATIKIIMPDSVSCANRGDECTTADVGAPYLAASMDTYGVKTGYEQAGILALISYESNQLQYKTNLNPVNKAGGQGTANE